MLRLIRTKMMRKGQEGKPCSPCGSAHPVDLLEQRATGGRQASKSRGRGFVMAVCGGGRSSSGGPRLVRALSSTTPRSEYVATALPAAALLGLPVSSPVDVNLFTCDPVLAALEPKRLVGVVRCVFF